LQLLNLALSTSSRAYSAADTASAASFIRDRRSEDRRQAQANIAFPDRRIVDRRGVAVSMKIRHEIRLAEPETRRSA
jgi:hypothetical protein